MFLVSDVYATSDSNWYNSNGPGILALDLSEHLDFLKACVQRGCMEAEAKGKEAHHFLETLPHRPDKLTFFFDNKARWFRYDDRCEKFHEFGSTALLEKLPSYMERGETEIEEAKQADIELDLTDPQSIHISSSFDVSENESVKIYIPSLSVDSIEQLPVFDWKSIEDEEILTELEEAASVSKEKKGRRRTASPGV